MLGNRITADDEDEVEAELAALEAQASGVSVPDNLPNVPNTNLPVKVPEREQQQGASKQPERQAMLAS